MKPNIKILLLSTLCLIALAAGQQPAAGEKDEEAPVAKIESKHAHAGLLLPKSRALIKDPVRIGQPRGLSEFSDVDEWFESVASFFDLSEWVEQLDIDIILDIPSDGVSSLEEQINKGKLGEVYGSRAIATEWLASTYTSSGSPGSEDDPLRAIYDGVNAELINWSFCSDGVRSGSTCCASSCGTCGGSGCSQREGGAANCCTGRITRTCENGRDSSCRKPTDIQVENADSVAPVSDFAMWLFLMQERAFFIDGFRKMRDCSSLTACANIEEMASMPMPSDQKWAAWIEAFNNLDQGDLTGFVVSTVQASGVSTEQILDTLEDLKVLDIDLVLFPEKREYTPPDPIYEDEYVAECGTAVLTILQKLSTLILTLVGAPLKLSAPIGSVLFVLVTSSVDATSFADIFENAGENILDAILAFLSAIFYTGDSGTEGFFRLLVTELNKEFDDLIMLMATVGEIIIHIMAFVLSGGTYLMWKAASFGLHTAWLIDGISDAVHHCG